MTRSGAATQAAPQLDRPRSECAISLREVELVYGPKIVLSDCSLDVKRGEVMCVIGLSGAGKSTILRVINGLRRPTAGQVLVDGVDIMGLTERELIEVRKKMGFAFQNAALFDSLSVAENVGFPLYEHTRMKKDEIEDRVSQVLDALGLAGVEQRMPSELSGGMQKRVGFARAIVNNPEIILFDEPTAGLDPIISNVITGTIKTIQKRLRATSVVVSHDLPAVFEVADSIAMLFEGTIIASGPVEEIRASANPIVQQFLQGSEIGPIPL